MKTDESFVPAFITITIYNPLYDFDLETKTNDYPDIAERVESSAA